MASVRFRDTLGMRARLLLLCCIYPLEAQHTPVPQFPELTKVQVGETISLQCDLKGLTTYCYTIAWMKIHPRTRKMEVCKNGYTDSNTGAKAGSQICHFSIKKAKLEDSGTYYCSAVHGQIIYTGNGSTVVVTEKRTEPPSIEILWPSDNSLHSSVPLLCLISGAVPSEVRVSWSIDGRNESGLTESIWTGESDAVTESVMNQVLVPVEEWERGITCTCMVDIDGNNTSKSVQSQGTNMCTVLLYGAIAGATVTIIVAICIAVYLHCGSSRESNASTWFVFSSWSHFLFGINKVNV
ncbi:immunoglobulin lambda-1 light chain-like [Megalops cyprinoides]|uniref:immunoglobulin lambda-1 light chain-like n=1 Tax=Megalops cyprinoides TaxID=118141 RepID=UPI001863CD7C|nr:immunoglobulin lambda-1 light chain-like [Megalops cyprinoides]